MASLTLMRALFATTTSTGLENLATPDPKEIAAPSSGASIGLDLGASFEVDTIFVGHIVTAATTVAIYTGASLGATTTLQSTPTLGPSTARRRHGFVKLGAPVSSRYWTLVFGSPAASATVGIAALGKSVQPAFGHEWGSGRLIRDMSQVTALRGGGFGIERGARAPGWQFTAGDLSDAEVVSLWDMVQEVGESAPVVVCEDPALAQPSLNEALHYGLFDRPEAYSREAPGLNRWSFRVKDWV